MSSGAKQSLSYSKEVVVGTTPTPFDRKVLPFTNVTLDAATTKEDSVTIADSRLPQQGSITAVDYTGDIEAELRYGVYDDLFEGGAYNKWVADSPAIGSDTLAFGGDTRQTFSIVRGYDDINNYHTFRGEHVNTLNITIPETGIVTTSFGMIGLGRVKSNTVPAGDVTSVTPLPPTFSSVSVEDIQIDGVTVVGVACVTAFDFTWDNTAQTQRCLGGGLDIGNVIATLANGTGSFTLAWSVKGADYYEKQFTNTTLHINVELKDGLGNIYVLDLPKIEVTANLPSGGNADILQATFEYRVVEEAPTLTRTPKP